MAVAESKNTSLRGFAALKAKDPELVRQIASKGGRALHEYGNPASYDSDTGRISGRISAAVKAGRFDEATELRRVLQDVQAKKGGAKKAAAPKKTEPKNAPAKAKPSAKPAKKAKKK